MKRLIIISIFLSTLFVSYGQKTSSDTIIIKSIKGNWAGSIDFGYQMHNMLNQDLFNPGLGQTYHYSIYRKNLFFKFGMATTELISNKETIFEDEIRIPSNTNFQSLSVYIALGYNYDFNSKWSADLNLGITPTGLQVAYPDNEQISYNSGLLSGTIAGIGVNRYFKLKGFNYLMLRLGADYYSTDYRPINDNLSTGSMNYNLTFAYKGWFRKIIEIK